MALPIVMFITHLQGTESVDDPCVAQLPRLSSVYEIRDWQVDGYCGTNRFPVRQNGVLGEVADQRMDGIRHDHRRFSG